MKSLHDVQPPYRYHNIPQLTEEDIPKAQNLHYDWVGTLLDRWVEGDTVIALWKSPEDKLFIIKCPESHYLLRDGAFNIIQRPTKTSWYVNVEHVPTEPRKETDPRTEHPERQPEEEQ